MHPVRGPAEASGRASPGPRARSGLSHALVLPLAFACALVTPAPAAAQAHPRHASPTPLLVLSVRVPAAKPPLAARGLLMQTAGGALIGSGAAMATAYGVLIVSGIAGPGDNLKEAEPPWPDKVTNLLIATTFTAGTVLGVYAAGEQQGMRGSPLATTAGTVGGLVAGVRIYEANETGGAALLMVTLPAAAGTAGYALTRTAR